MLFVTQKQTYDGDLQVIMVNFVTLEYIAIDFTFGISTLAVGVVDTRLLNCRVECFVSGSK